MSAANWKPPESAAPPAPSPAPPTAPAPTPPPRPPLRLPTGVTGAWRRDWRLRGELVGRGRVGLHEDGVRIEGRRSTPARGLIALGLKGLLLLGWLGVAAASLLTASGLSFRTGQIYWMILAPIIGLPLGGLMVWLPLHLLGRLAQPRVDAKAPWSQVRVGSDGRTLVLSVTVDGRHLWGRLQPGLLYRSASRVVLQGVQQGALPEVAREAVGRPLRSAWVDRAALLILCLSIGGAYTYLEPVFRRWRNGGEPETGPLAGLPEPVSAGAVEGRRPRSCVAPDPGAPRVKSRREGGVLHWELEERGPRLRGARANGWGLGHLAADPVSGTLRWLSPPQGPASAGSLTLPEGDLAVLSVVVPADRIEEATRGLASGWSGFNTGQCGGLVAAVDVALARPTFPAPALRAQRDGDDLLVQMPEAPADTLVFPVRWHPSAGSAWLDPCDLPALNGQPARLVAREQRRFKGFFGARADEARVYALPASSWAALETLARTGSEPACVAVDALVWAGLATRADTLARDPAPLAARASAIAREAPMIPENASAEEALSGITVRYQAVVDGLRQRGRGSWDAINEGFLDAVPWSALIDRVSFKDGLPRLERARQRLSGADPTGAAGAAFLFRFAQAFLDTVPPSAETWLERFQVGEAWIRVDAGQTWRIDGREVRVPDKETAEVYQVIGRFVLADLARHIEEDEASGEGGTLSALLMSVMLKQHNINLNLQRSTLQKGLYAWATGDFEYLTSRAWLKAQQQLRDEESALAAAEKAHYSLRRQWVARDGALVYADVLREDRAFGWLTLADPAKIKVDDVPVDGRSASRQGLADRGTPLLLTSGSYVTTEGRTAGLSAYNGRIVNFLLDPKMDGLVLFEGGAVHVLDLRRGGRLPGLDRPLQPLNDLGDLHALIRWIRDRGASGFQTHLLASGGALTIDPSRASAELRERRLLVLARYKTNPIVGVLDIPGANRQSLAEAARVALLVFSTPESRGGPGLTVDAIANLDVGSYDILMAWTDEGALARQGPVDLSLAKNLLRFTR